MYFLYVLFSFSYISIYLYETLLVSIYRNSCICFCMLFIYINFFYHRVKIYSRNFTIVIPLSIANLEMHVIRMFILHVCICLCVLHVSHC